MYLCKTGQTCLISSSGKIDACCRSSVLRLFGLVLLISLISSTQHKAELVTDVETKEDFPDERA